MNLYEILGVEFTATLREIKKAYHNKCMEYHPDTKGNEPHYHEMMCKINEAYEILSNPEKRRQYDESLFNETKNKETSSHKEERATSQYSTYSTSDSSEKKDESKKERWSYQSYYYEDLEQEEYECYINWMENYIYEYKKRFSNLFNENEDYYKILKYFENIIDYEYEQYTTKYKRRQNYMSK